MSKPSRGEYAAATLLGPVFGLDPWTSKRWQSANELNRAERIAVMRTTRRGNDIGDARLAPAVIDYARVLRETRDRFFRGQVSLITGLAVFLVLTGPVLHSNTPIVALATGLATAAVLFVVSGLRGLRNTLSKATQAETSARHLA
jgi:hypothetical protein